MNSVIKSGEAERMSSLQIAEVTGKKHQHIMRDIRELLKQGLQASNFGRSSYKQELPNGGYKDVPCYLLTKKGCLILASGYDALLREKIIDRLEELETQARLSQSLRTEEVLLSLESRVRALETSRRLSADAGEQILTPGIEHQAAYGLGGKGLYVCDYNERSIVVVGEASRRYRRRLKALGGRYCPFLRRGDGGSMPGWVFPLRYKGYVLEQLSDVLTDDPQDDTVADHSNK